VRLFLDTNVILSGILFPNGVASRFLRAVSDSHTILIGEYVIDELRIVFDRKFPQHREVLEAFLRDLPATHNGLSLRDPKDAPILGAAAAADSDVLVTGDKDILSLTDTFDFRIATMRSVLESMVSPDRDRDN